METLTKGGDRKKRVQIEGNKFRYRHKETGPWDWEATVTLEPTATPKRITLTRTIKADGKEKTVVDSGIYKRTTDGEYLELHFGLEPKKPPRDFLVHEKPVKGVDGRVWTLKRAGE
jgi:uncharacterized protein (TIGR03067 family)